jgi:polysaccharide biosynthesis transport protein
VQHFDNAQLLSTGGMEAQQSSSLKDRIDVVMAFLRRRYLIILVFLLLALPFGGLYLYLTPKSYTASAIMMIETRGSVLKDSLFNGAPIESAWIESQAGILTSANVAAYVVKQLRLQDDPQFVESASPIDRLFSLIDRLFSPPAEPKTEAQRVSDAIGAVMGGLSVRRVGQSYMMRIDYRSQNSALAVKVANAMIDGYIFEHF